jgi:hypothetical protein
MRTSTGSGTAVQLSILQDNVGVPGVQIGSGSDQPNIDTSETQETFTFSTPVKLSPNTKYWVKIQNSFAGLDIIIRTDTSGATLPTEQLLNNSLVSVGKTANIVLEKTYSIAGGVKKAEADVAGKYETTIGFMTESKSAPTSSDNTGQVKAMVQFTGILSGFSGLTPGLIYYVSNTPGIISSTPGSNTKKVGVAVSETELFIDVD